MFWIEATIPCPKCHGKGTITTKKSQKRAFGTGARVGAFLGCAVGGFPGLIIGGLLGGAMISEDTDVEEECSQCDGRGHLAKEGCNFASAFAASALNFAASSAASARGFAASLAASVLRFAAGSAASFLGFAASSAASVLGSAASIFMRRFAGLAGHTPRGWHGCTGKTMKMYHGTTPANAKSIMKTGFNPSSSGMLGEGVYVSSDIEKAKRYGSAILTVEVKLGRTKKIDSQSHPMRTSWNTQGYDSAWVPPNCGMVHSGLTETCVFDRNRIRVISTMSM